MSFIDGLISTIAVIVFIVLVISVISAPFILLENAIQKGNCKNLEKNGYDVKIEYVLGISDCYVGVEYGKYVPYDRFVGGVNSDK